MQAVYYFFNTNESMNNLRVLHEGMPSSMHLLDTVANQYCDPSQETEAKANKTVLCLLPLYMSGCISPDRDTVWPNIATSGLRIKINLNDAQTALQAISAPIYDTLGAPVSAVTNGEYKTKYGGGYEDTHAYEVQVAAAIGDTTIKLKSTADTLTVSGNVLSKAVAGTAHLFVVGQTISVNGTNKVISSVTIGDADDNYRIEIGFEALVAAVPINSKVFIVVGSAETPDESFQMSNVHMNISTVVPPAGYVNQVITAIKQGKMMLDIRTYTDYSVNIGANSQTNTLYINARNSRAKSILSIPYGSSSNSFVEDSFIPNRGTPSSYQYSIYNVLTPNLLTSLNRSNLESFDAVHLRELQHGVAASDIPVNRLYKSYKHFMIARRLAMPGYSYNMNDPSMGEVRLSVNYKQVSATLMHNFVVHLRRIIIRDDGISIIY